MRARSPRALTVVGSSAALGADDSPVDDGVDRRVGGDRVDDDVEQRIARLLDVRPLAEHRVAVPAGVHEVVRDEPDAVRRPDRGQRPADAVRRLPHADDDRSRAVARVLDFEPRDLREPAGADVRVAFRREAVQERGLQLGSGEREDRRPVAERQHGERLAPGDLAGRLTRARRGEAQVGAEPTPSS